MELCYSFCCCFCFYEFSYRSGGGKEVTVMDSGAKYCHMREVVVLCSSILSRNLLKLSFLFCFFLSLSWSSWVHRSTQKHLHELWFFFSFSLIYHVYFFYQGSVHFSRMTFWWAWYQYYALGLWVRWWSWFQDLWWWKGWWWWVAWWWIF